MLKSGSSRIFRREDLFFYVCIQKKEEGAGLMRQQPDQRGAAPDCILADRWKERGSGVLWCHNSVGKLF